MYILWQAAYKTEDMLHTQIMGRWAHGMATIKKSMVFELIWTEYVILIGIDEPEMQPIAKAGAKG